jgi:alkanesulfonate monooxygenase SsuD/methylene tetrahydromethanopterin reductase-like flavin-dependent oxidoreductase (luciferase family)
MGVGWEQAELANYGVDFDSRDERLAEPVRR